MKKYNLSRIMKRAWTLKRTYKGTFAHFLKMAWREEKEGKLVSSAPAKRPVAHTTDKEIGYIATWFLRKNFTQNEVYAIQLADLTAYKETEKAYLIKADSDWGVLRFWAPKSVCFA